MSWTFVVVVVGSQAGRQRPPGPGQPGLDRPDGDVELGRDPVDGQVEQVVQDDHGPLVAGQGAEGLDDGQPVKGRWVRFGPWPQPHGQGQPAPGVAEPVGWPGSPPPADPGLGDFVLAQPRPAARGPGQGLLDDVLGVVEIPGDQVELADQATEDGGVELVEARLARQSAPSRPRVGGRDAISTSEGRLGFPRS